MVMDVWTHGPMLLYKVALSFAHMKRKIDLVLDRLNENLNF